MPIRKDGILRDLHKRLGMAVAYYWKTREAQRKEQAEADREI